MAKIAAKEDLYKIIERLVKDFEVIGPKQISGKEISYRKITAAVDLYLGDGVTLEPVKKFFLKPSEYLFREADGVLEEMPAAENKRIIFGVRPCEARGLTLLDKVFNSEYTDDSYARCRKNTVIVGFSCLNPDGSCFCTSIAGSPNDSRGMDAIIHVSGSGFVIESVSAKGEDIFSAFGKDLSRAEEELLGREKEARSRALKKKMNFPEMLEGGFAGDYWEKAVFPCVSCGICTYLCPTCHCFDLVDENRKRLRCYDGCSFNDFTLEASGANPRPTKKERYRQRVLHKFEYFRKNFGENLCVGCGRCIRHCPVKMDISEIVANMPLTSKV